MIGFYQPDREAKIESYKVENKYLSKTTMCAIIHLCYVARLVQFYLYLITGYQQSIH